LKSLQIQDIINEQDQIIPKLLSYYLRDTLAKLAVNVDFFTARLEAQRSSNVHNVTKNLIKTLMQLGIFY
jgi:hypothetical protein